MTSAEALAACVYALRLELSDAVWRDVNTKAADVLAEVARLREAFNEYSAHQSWRCEYRSRYKKCACGLDDLVAELGLDPVPVDDPEEKPRREPFDSQLDYPERHGLRP